MVMLTEVWMPAGCFAARGKTDVVSIETGRQVRETVSYLIES